MVQVVQAVQVVAIVKQRQEVVDTERRGRARTAWRLGAPLEQQLLRGREERGVVGEVDAPAQHVARVREASRRARMGHVSGRTV